MSCCCKALILNVKRNIPRLFPTLIALLSSLVAYPRAFLGAGAPTVRSLKSMQIGLQTAAFFAQISAGQTTEGTVPFGFKSQN
jgi:hypothetical protein